MIQGLRLQLNLAMAHWPRLSHAFQEAGQLWLLKIELGPGDRYNWYPGSNRVKGACMAVQVGPYSDTGGLGSVEVTILWPSWHISLAFGGWRRFKWESFYNYPHRVFAYLEVHARQYDIANISFLFCCLAIFYGLQLHFGASHVKSYYWNQKR